MRYSAIVRDDAGNAVAEVTLEDGHMVFTLQDHEGSQEFFNVLAGSFAERLKAERAPLYAQMEKVMRQVYLLREACDPEELESVDQMLTREWRQ